jgi:hypothetical protein
MPRAQRLACAVVELPVVLGTFDDVVHHQAVGQMHLFMRAEPVGAEELVVAAAIDGEGTSAMVEADQVPERSERSVGTVVAEEGFEPPTQGL